MVKAIYQQLFLSRLFGCIITIVDTQMLCAI